MASAVFTNDNGVTIVLDANHRHADAFRRRDNHEVIFRRTVTWLINNTNIRNIIDLGAWIGDNTIPWAKNIGGIVYAIDPSPENCDFIKSTCALNGVRNVRVIQSAISDANEILKTDGDLTHCSFVGVRGAITHSVRAVTLDHLFAQGELADVGLIHLDVEGMEGRVVGGASRLIQACRPIIAFEQHLLVDNYMQLSASLAEKGYRIYIINEILPGCHIDCRNFIAFPNEMGPTKLVESINHHLGMSPVRIIDSGIE